MAKYVRTKDGRIFERNKVSVVNENGVEIVMFGIDNESVERTRGKTWNCGTNVIVKQADTIEELCDEFVVCHNGKTICQFARNVWDYEQIKYLGTSNDFYGAIWTDKGLIYVAKMNEKGELELI